jgi:hypothetical protein
MATLVEEEPTLLDGERVTALPPLPMEEYARTMMAVDDGTGAAPTEAAPDVEVSALEVGERVDLAAEVAEGLLERLGKRTDVAYVGVSSRELMKLQLTHQEGFVLALVDGATSLQEIIDLTAMLEHETLSVLDQLRERGIIVVRADPRRE